MFRHYLLLNPLYNSPRDLDFVSMVKPQVKFNFYFFFLNIFWFAQHKMYGMAVAWLSMMFFLFNVWTFSLSFEMTNPIYPILSLNIVIIPHFLVSFFVDKFLLIHKENIIWKYRNQPKKQESKITAHSIAIVLALGIVAFVLAFKFLFMFNFK